MFEQLLLLVCHAMAKVSCKGLVNFVTHFHLGVHLLHLRLFGYDAYDVLSMFEQLYVLVLVWLIKTNKPTQ